MTHLPLQSHILQPHFLHALESVAKKEIQNNMSVGEAAIILSSSRR